MNVLLIAPFRDSSGSEPCRDSVAKRSYRLLGERIKELRKRAGYERPEFAEAVGLAKTSVPSLEGGYYRPDTSLLGRIAVVLGADYNELAQMAGYYVPPTDETWTPPTDKVSPLKKLARLSRDRLEQIALAFAGDEAEVLNPRLRRTRTDEPTDAGQP